MARNRHVYAKEARMKIESPVIYARQIWDVIRNAGDSARSTAKADTGNDPRATSAKPRAARPARKTTKTTKS